VPELHLGKYRRYLWQDANLLVVIGDFPEVLVSKQLYQERHQIPVAEGAAVVLLERIMATAALIAVSLAERESWGWTITLPGSPYGVFCGVEPEGMVCARVRPTDPNKTSAFVQRQKGKGPVTQSHYEPTSDDVAATMAAYFDQVQQQWTRIAVDDQGSGVLVQALPDASIDEAAALDDDELIARCRSMAGAGELDELDEVVIFYECRCHDEMILDMITSLPTDQREDLWGNEAALEIECPRCGRKYVLNRDR
jgi:redox-regulated HSP33 family molecular chaperone